VEIDTGISFGLPLSRSFWSTPASFTAIDLTEHAVDDDKRLEAFRILAAMHRLDWRSMRQHIAAIVGKYGTATIGQIIENYPPRIGVVELLAYLQIARDDGHLISRQNTEQVYVRALAPSERDLQVTIPLVYFVASQRGAHA
jgi:hypothetical protein